MDDIPPVVPHATALFLSYGFPQLFPGHPIVDLSPDRRDVHRYVRDLEEVMIRVTGAYGVEAGRIQGLSGAWVRADKIGAIGVRVSRWITSHGFAYNVKTDLDYFKLIVPCGITDRGVTSLSKLLGREVDVREVEDVTIRAFCDVFGYETTTFDDFAICRFRDFRIDGGDLDNCRTAKSSTREIEK